MGAANNPRGDNTYKPNSHLPFTYTSSAQVYVNHQTAPSPAESPSPVGLQLRLTQPAQATITPPWLSAATTRRPIQPLYHPNRHTKGVHHAGIQKMPLLRRRNPRRGKKMPLLRRISRCRIGTRKTGTKIQSNGNIHPKYEYSGMPQLP